MGIISKSVAHACSGGARGFFKPNDQEYGEAAGVVKFHRDQEKPGRYVSEFRGPARVSCKHAHRAAQPRKAAQALLRSRDHWVRTLKLYRGNACETSSGWAVRILISYLRSSYRTVYCTIRPRLARGGFARPGRLGEGGLTIRGRGLTAASGDQPHNRDRRAPRRRENPNSAKPKRALQVERDEENVLESPNTVQSCLKQKNSSSRKGKRPTIKVWR